VLGSVVGVPAEAKTGELVDNTIVDRDADFDQFYGLIAVGLVVEGDIATERWMDSTRVAC